MFHAMRSKSVFGSTMFGMPLIRDIWFLYSCVSSSSWTFLFVLFYVFVCSYIVVPCMYVCVLYANKRWWWWWWYKSQYAAFYTQLCLRYWTVSWTELEFRKNLINFQSMNLSTWHYTVVCSRSLSLYMDISETRSGAMNAKIIISKSDRKRSSTILYRTFRSRFIHADDRNVSCL